ncbi:hypothetical protein MASR2M15_14670 [Anaerolineales bacterium]
MDDDLFFLADDKPSRADAMRNREKLLQVATQLFDQYPVEDVTMSQIAQSAQVGKGTLYRNFQDKGTLCIALLDQSLRTLQEETLTYLRQDLPPYAKLVWFLKQVINFNVQNQEILQEVRRNATTDETVIRAHGWWYQTIFALLKQIDPTHDWQYISHVFYTALDIQAIQYQLDYLHYTQTDIEQQMLAMLDRLLD